MSSHLLKQTLKDATAAARSAYFTTAFQTDEEQVAALSCLQRLLSVFLLSYVQRLLCGLAPVLFTAVAPILFTALDVWFCFYLIPVYSACGGLLFLSYVQRLLCGIALILLAALAVCFCFYLM